MKNKWGFISLKFRLAGILLLALIAVIFPQILFASVVQVRKEDGVWRLYIDGVPSFIKGVAYSPNKIGETPDFGPNWAREWMVVDDNKNGRNDFAYDSYVDANLNGQQEASEKPVGDFQLMKDMGVNVIRVYHHSSDDPSLQAGYGGNPSALAYHNHPPNKSLMREMFNKYGIRAAMGDYLGAYTISSGASWDPGTDYTNAVQKQRMMTSVERMVLDFKDEPYLLIYILGNENTFEWTHTNARTHPVEYAQFVEQAVRRIHELDPNHPVAICIGETNTDGNDWLQILKTHAPSVDIFGANIYRYSNFGNLWNDVSQVYDKPVLPTEYGDLNPYVSGTPLRLDEDHQKFIYESNWVDIEDHGYLGSGVRNAIGGFAFVWLDDWWQDGAPFIHNLNAQGIHHEWMGIAAQANAATSPYLRQLRKIYFAFQKQWTVGDPQLTGQAISPSRMEWTWGEVENGEKYQMFTSTGGDLLNVVLPGNFLPWIDDGFTPDSPITRLVQVQNGYTVKRTAPITRYTQAVSIAGTTVTIVDAHTMSVAWEKNGNPSNTRYHVRAESQTNGHVFDRFSSSDQISLQLEGLTAQTPYHVWVEAVNGDGVETNAHEFVEAETPPAPVGLPPVSAVGDSYAYPNPFRTAQTTSLKIRAPADTRIRIYTVIGELVYETLSDSDGETDWYGRNSSGESVASGVYLIMLEQAGAKKKVKVALLR